MIEFDRTLGRRKIDRVLFVVERVPKVEHLEDTIKGDESSHDVDARTRQRSKRFINACDQCRQSNECAKSDRLGNN